MKKFSIRVAKEEDSQTYLKWLMAAGDINLVDFGVYSYPTCNTIVVEADNQPKLMDSFHLVMMMEALAPEPGIEPKDEARALRKLYEGLRNVAVASGVREIWFTCVDERLHKFIEAKGFHQVNTPVFRMVLGGETDPLNLHRPEGTNIQPKVEAHEGE